MDEMINGIFKDQYDFALEVWFNIPKGFGELGRTVIYFEAKS